MSNIINIQGSKPNTRKRISLKKRLIIAAIFVLLIGIGVGAWWYFNNNPSNKDEGTVNPNVAIMSVINGKYKEGQATLDKSINNTTDSAVKAKLYIEKSAISLNSKDYADAYNFAKKAEELKPDRYSAQMMAEAASQKGDKNEAIAKYKLSISRINGTSGIDKLDIQELQGKISKLEGQK